MHVRVNAMHNTNVSAHLHLLVCTHTHTHTHTLACMHAHMCTLSVMIHLFNDSDAVCHIFQFQQGGFSSSKHLCLSSTFLCVCVGGGAFLCVGVCAAASVSVIVSFSVKIK